MYCEIIRFGSSAGAGTAKHTSANPAMAHSNDQRLPNRRSGKVFKLLNYDLGGFLKGILVASDDVKNETDPCLTR